MVPDRIRKSHLQLSRARSLETCSQVNFSWLPHLSSPKQGKHLQARSGAPRLAHQHLFFFLDPGPLVFRHGVMSSSWLYWLYTSTWHPRLVCFFRVNQPQPIRQPPMNINKPCLACFPYFWSDFLSNLRWDCLDALQNKSTTPVDPYFARPKNLDVKAPPRIPPQPSWKTGTSQWISRIGAKLLATVPRGMIKGPRCLMRGAKFTAEFLGMDCWFFSRAKTDGWIRYFNRYIRWIGK